MGSLSNTVHATPKQNKPGLYIYIHQITLLRLVSAHENIAAPFRVASTYPLMIVLCSAEAICGWTTTQCDSIFACVPQSFTIWLF